MVGTLRDKDWLTLLSTTQHSWEVSDTNTAKANVGQCPT